MQGAKVQELEGGFASFIGSKHCIAVANGTLALDLALRACGVGAGDLVVTTPFTFVATANAILHVGATPVFADIDPDTFCLDPKKALKVAGKRTKAILPVHLFGMPCDMTALMEAAAADKITVVEDAAQAHGAKWGGKAVGTFGKAGVFSFYPTKNMTTGEGGMIATDDDEVAEFCRQFRNQGQVSKYEYARFGMNYRMTDIHAAIGLAQLRRLAQFNEARRRNALLLTEALQGVKGLQLPEVPPNAEHVFHQYTVRVLAGREARDALQEHLKREDVASGVYYPMPLHKVPHIRVRAKRGYPVAERAADEVLSLPCHPGLTGRELAHVAVKVREFFTAHPEAAVGRQPPRPEAAEAEDDDGDQGS